MEEELAVGGKILQELELGRQEEVVAEEHLVDNEEPEVHLEPYSGEQWEEEQGAEGGLVTVEHFLLEDDDLMQVVHIVEENEVLVEGEDILWELELWGEEEVTEEQFLNEVEVVVQQGIVREQQWEEEGLEVEVVVGGEVFQELEVVRQEEVEAEELLVEEKEENDVLEMENRESDYHHEERIENAEEQFELEGEDSTQSEREVEETEDESQAEDKEQGEESVKQEQAGPGHGGRCTWSTLEALQALQAEMQPLNEEAGRAFSRFRRRTRQRRQPHLELRSNVIQHMHGFWARAFVNHPELSAMISDQDENMLSFMMDLKVEKDSDRCKIVLLFHSNPYFRNDVIVKEYIITLTGPRATYSTPIQWHAHFEGQAYSRRHHNSSLNFFNWFSEHDLAGSGRIVEFICNDLWPNPLKYYVRKTAAGDGAETRTGNN